MSSKCYMVLSFSLAAGTGLANLPRVEGGSKHTWQLMTNNKLLIVICTECVIGGRNCIVRGLMHYSICSSNSLVKSVLLANTLI